MLTTIDKMTEDPWATVLSTIGQSEGQKKKDISFGVVLTIYFVWVLGNTCIKCMFYKTADRRQRH